MVPEYRDRELSDDDEDTRTVVGASRLSARGKIPLSSRGRRDNDKMSLKDWIGYAITVLSPVAGALFATYVGLQIMEVKVSNLQAQHDREFQQVKNAHNELKATLSIERDKREDGDARLWRSIRAPGGNFE